MTVYRFLDAMGEVVDERQFTIHAALHVEQLRQPSLVESAMAEHATALLHALDTAVANVAGLEQTLTLAFDQHPDADHHQLSRPEHRSRRPHPRRDRR